MKQFDWLVLLILGLTLRDDCVSRQICLKALNSDTDPSDPPFNDENNNGPLPADNAVQAIITTYKFYCDCVNITSWETYVQPGGPGHTNSMAYDITFQVWRPSPTVNDSGCYSLVGENVFTSFSFTLGGTVQLSPPSSSIITAQSGDVVGYYTNSREGSNDGIQLERNSIYTQNIIWYQTTDSNGLSPLSSSNCPYPVGSVSGRILTSSINAAPMLKLVTTTFPCVTSTPLPSQSSIPSLHSEIQVSSTVPMSVLLPSGPSGSGSGNNGKIALVSGIVVFLVIVMASALGIVLAIVFLLRRRKTTRKDPKGLDLSNPNYESLSVPRDTKKASHNTKAVKFFSKPFSQEAFGTKKEELTYESVQDKKKSDAHYPTVDLNAGLGSQASNSSTAPPVTARDIVKPSEQDTSYSESCYEDPVQTKFRDSSKTKFETTGYYVPTEEERSVYEAVNQEHPNSVNHYNKLNFFEEDDIYWAPATTTSGLYSQLASKKYREIPRSQISLQNPLGSGQFGEVYKATWSIDEQELELAVKTLKAGASEEDKIKFLQEAAIMGQFSHINVIKMYGVITLEEPILICLELLKNGDLRGYLQGLKLTGSKYGDFMKVQRMFLKFAREIAAGMEYLSKKSFVHRDLAARNILLDKSLTCKVADFGMARDLMDDTYYTSSGGQIPVKWTAPEALLFKKYSADSDVWSYGMVLFEIWSVARKPFSTVTNSQVIRLLNKGFCQAPPPGCPRAIYEVMVDCWNPDHQSRPSFGAICQNYLKQPSSRLLYWAPEDNNLSPAVGIPGAPLEEAEKLYLDLQKKYITL